MATLVRIFVFILFTLFLGACTNLSRIDEEKAPVEDRSDGGGKPVNKIEKTIIDAEKKHVPVLEIPESDNETGEIQKPALENNQENQPGSGSSTVNTSNPAVIALLDDVDQFANSGQPEKAIARLERAIRIDPGNPLLWHKLGKLRLNQKKWDLAISMAQKSNTLAADYLLLQAQNWIIIADAKEGLGDRQGARQAREKSVELQK